MSSKIQHDNCQNTVFPGLATDKSMVFPRRCTHKVVL